MSLPYFEALLNKYITGSLSPAEKIALGQMIDQPVYTETLEAYVQEIMLSDEFAGIDSPTIKAGIFAHLDDVLAHPAASVAPPRIRRLSIVRYAAAVLLLLAVTGGYWAWVNHQKNARLADTQILHNDIQPGHNGAILTLAGGRQVILDSTRDGTITQQGNMAVVKGNGQLSYQSKGKEEEVMYNTMSTPRGRQYQLLLADGTHVWLNAASSITFPTAFTGKERKVTITGEAYLEVSADASRPFTIAVGNTTVDVLGTSLNINSYMDEDMIKTTLLSGKVRVSNQGNSLLLEPGEQVQTGGPGGPEKVESVETDEVIAWKNDLFQFQNANLETVMRQIARWYDVDVQYEGKIPEIVFSGKLHRDVNASQVLEILHYFKVRFRIEDGQKGKKIIITS